jgi:tetratricopeptide (TPR) repeat protein
MRYGLLLLLLTCTRVMAQQEHMSVCDRMRMADSLLAKNDTTAALREYEELDRSSPINGLSPGACLKIGKLYMTQGRRQDAARIWQRGLVIRRNDLCPYDFGTADYYNQYLLAKPSIAFQLSDLFNDSPDSVYKYTLWADTVYCTPFTCGNAWEDYHAKISPRVAQIYLDRGDTAKAYSRLCLSLLFNVAAAKKLKSLLLLYHDQKNIDGELKKCMRHPKKIDAEYGYLVYSLFGYDILRTYDDHRKGVTGYLRKNKSIVFLQSPSSVTY